jgi:hypothetical protein
MLLSREKISDPIHALRGGNMAEKPEDRNASAATDRKSVV